jgi:MOSC domain-containing protein YiiM
MAGEAIETQGKLGHIFQINVSNGGVPKLAVLKAEVTALGLVGDRQANMDVHGGVERAVCLYSLERILALQAEGHGIFPGAIGENLTIAGVNWVLVEPGVRLRFGGDVLVEINRFTSPCNKIAYALSGGELSRVSQIAHPGWSRVYARVIQSGWIKVGDGVTIELASE